MKKVHIILIALAVIFLISTTLFRTATEDYTSCIVELDDGYYSAEDVKELGKKRACDDERSVILAFEKCKESVNKENILKTKHITAISRFTKPSSAENYQHIENIKSRHNKFCQEYPETLLVE